MSEIQVGGGGASAILYHVRIRGKIYGPYAIEKLQELAKKSVVSRINQVSVDGGNSWQPASEFTEIFVTAAVQVTIPVQPVAGPVAGGPLQATSAELPWYYLINGQKYGPTTLSQLQMMVSTGTLNPADYACQEGAADWSRVDMVPELMSIIRGSGIGGGGSGGGGSGGTKTEGAELSGRVKNAFRASRPWTMMMAILAFIFAGVLLMFGILVFFSGMNEEFEVFGIISVREGTAPDELSPEVILIAVGSLLSAVASALGGVMLLLHSGKISGFVKEATEKRLAPVGESVSRVWLFLAITATVYLVAFTVFVILILSGVLVVGLRWP